MKKIIIRLVHGLLFVLIISTSQTFAQSAQLFQGNGKIDRINKEERVMVIGDGYFKVAEDIKVHSQFVNKDYFSRLKKGMEIKFTYIKNSETRYWYLKEIWIQN